METTITAEKIHADFYGAEERLYVEAIGLSKGSLVTNSSKAERLKKIGFGNAKPIKDDIEIGKKRSISGHVIKCIEYFRTYYPQNKFITDAEVKTLCEKYGLLLGDAANYIGDMPEKNLQDIERFKLRKEDWKEKVSYSWLSFPQSELVDWFRPSAQPLTDEYGLLNIKARQSGRNSMFNEDRLIAQYYALMSQQIGIPESRQGSIGIDKYVKEEPKKEYEQPAFKICAPKEDFNTMGYEIRDGYRLVYDPIVLQPVSKDGIDGYLIVTAWGNESTDEAIKNPASN